MDIKKHPNLKMIKISQIKNKKKPKISKMLTNNNHTKNRKIIYLKNKNLKIMKIIQIKIS